MNLKEKIDNLPKTPGIYMMKDKYGDVIYVGKSKKLKERVKSYFVNSKNHSRKVKRLVKNIEDLDVILTDTELDALILECEMIKKIRPMYNQLLKNHENYSYIKINKNIKSQIILYSVMLFIVLGLMVGYAYSQSCKINTFSNDYKENLIRFHVLANSDSEEDQALKLKVRDKVISYLKPKLEDSESISQSEKIILNEKDKLMDICKETIKQNGYNYDVSINLGYSKFPTKQYSSVVLPAGEYKSLKIIIGKGQGKNWWCVMFPPLCFVDEQNNVIDKETDEKLKKVLTKDEYELIVEKDKKNINNLQIKFKIVEVFQKILNLEKEDKISINN